VLKERIVFLVCFWSLLTFIRSRFQAKPATLLISNKFPSRLYCLCAFPLINVEIALCKSSLFFCPFYLIITYNELNKVARGWPFQIKGLVITEGTVVMHHTVWWCVCVCGVGVATPTDHLRGTTHTTQWECITAMWYRYSLVLAAQVCRAARTSTQCDATHPICSRVC